MLVALLASSPPRPTRRRMLGTRSRLSAVLTIGCLVSLVLRHGVRYGLGEDDFDDPYHNESDYYDPDDSKVYSVEDPKYLSWLEKVDLPLTIAATVTFVVGLAGAITGGVLTQISRKRRARKQILPSLDSNEAVSKVAPPPVKPGVPPIKPRILPGTPKKRANELPLKQPGNGPNMNNVKKPLIQKKLKERNLALRKPRAKMLPNKGPA
eukprot:GHVT01078425.1.p1 GENE.GHVT01078425.1~~GHVT01078425.1.p1  ORF type:complete len:209 (-),score=20.88 GHVT01078425.1:325-951(-)